jgi:hypothetical protein
VSARERELEAEQSLMATALASRSPALASTLVTITRFVERPSAAEAQRVVCQLDCAGEECSEPATRAICQLLARCWLYGNAACH